jgi:methionyl-tRNA formyltransferase
VRWAVSAGETYTGVSWFWADAGLDTGPVCEQDVIAISPGESPGQLYRSKMIPAGLRCLRRLLVDLANGHRRSVPQNEEAATYESWLMRRESTR